MAELILTGGYGSTPEQYHHIATAVGNARGTPTTGYGLREAHTNLATFAEHIDRQEVMTHSGGLLVVHDAVKLGAQPSKITAIAPSVPSQVRSLVSRGILIGLHDPVEQEQFDEKINSASTKRELLEHPLFYAKIVHRLGHFASLDFLADMAARDTDVTAVMMSHDGLFDNGRVALRRQQLVRACGGKIVEVAGVHTSFTAAPTAILERIAIAEASQAHEAGRQYQMPVDFIFDTIKGAARRYLDRTRSAGTLSY